MRTGRKLSWPGSITCDRERVYTRAVSAPAPSSRSALPIALTIAGSDPSGGAGLQADIKTFHQHGVYGAAVVTLLTVQNTRRVDAVMVVDATLVGRQIDVVLEDLPPAAVKTGALGSAAVVSAVAERAARFGCPLVVDPVMISSHGTPLLAPDGQAALAERLLPHAALVTPNLAEAGVLAGFVVDGVDAMERAARAIAARGARAVLVTGGHLTGETAADVLYDSASGAVRVFESPRIAGADPHGTGCVLSAAITALLAKGGTLTGSIEAAKRFVTAAIESRPAIGGEHGPLGLHVATEPPAVSSRERVPR